MSQYTLELAQKLMQRKSVTPENDGAIELLAEELAKLGFKNTILSFSDNNLPEIHNLYAKFGNSAKNLAFAGHTDVVPAGDITKWSFDPFSATIDNNILYGRGAVDMKVAIACFLGAVKLFLAKNPDFNNSISFLITGDEEDIAINGTVKVIDYLVKNNEKISHTIVGEPTNPEKIGEMVKVGRRGSVNFTLTAIGKQGHVAYPENAINPITALIKTLNLLIDHQFDLGNKYFDPTHLEVTSFDVDNSTTNIIPESATAKFNIRFNSEYDSKQIIQIIDEACSKTLAQYELDHRVSGESFLTEDINLQNMITTAVKDVVGKAPILSTTGGTSDARFIKNICPTIEFGLINKTAHQIDEHIALDDIEKLEKIYLRFLELYFQS
ncbi:MAG: succinyl-diaminopimelate desuccinylase [Alphaproteobacteria bacterium]|jgi:succinyl-diaminopimelate desuccinylase|nr:succinyl-diaminopimelate desuccinylase [Alphaproteobacteria bacterium]MBT5828415.1 succinyl-diaminopimelate desuccinylase [Alphaproteobacteria bacterium]